ncbi:MAG: aspartate kinase [Alistipes sp.]|nr:aspartate kinase [Alistipes sp.]
MKVYKFGGASVRHAEGVRNLLNIVSGEEELFVIVSAMGKTTNALEEVFDAMRKGDTAFCEQKIDEIKAYHYTTIADLFGSTDYRIEEVDALFEALRKAVTTNKFERNKAEEWYDHIVAYGELVSTTIISAFLNKEGVANTWIDMRKCFMTQARHKDANVLIEQSKTPLRLAVAGAENRIFVGQGFIGSAPDGTTTTLGREGSDYSAAVVANILNAESMTVWKDVDGILNADPKIFPDAVKIDQLNYVDTIELAYSGAQIIHPKTIKPLQNKNIPLYVKPFGNKLAAGTTINGSAPTISTPIIILKRNQSFLRLRSRDLSFVLEEKFPIIFATLERFRIKTNLIHNTAVELGLCVEENWHLEEVAEALKEEGFNAEIIDKVELLTIRHYNDELLNKYVACDDFIISQLTPDTVRYVRPL